MFTFFKYKSNKVLKSNKVVIVYEDFKFYFSALFHLNTAQNCYKSFISIKNSCMILKLNQQLSTI